MFLRARFVITAYSMLNRKVTTTLDQYFMGVLLITIQTTMFPTFMISA
jgi:hypothetical protein